MKRNAMLYAGAFLLPALCARAETAVWEGTVDLPSYAISAPEKSPVFDYEGNRYGSTLEAKNASAARRAALGRDVLDKVGEASKRSRRLP